MMDVPRRSADDADMPTHPKDTPASDPQQDAGTGSKPAPSPKAGGPSAIDSLGNLSVEDTDQLLHLADRVGKLHDRIATQTKSEVNGLFELLGSKRRLLFVNFMAGLARGAGFFLGVTLIGGLIIGALAFFVDTTTRFIGMNDVTFRSITRTLAEQAMQAKQVWKDVEDQQVGTDPALEPGADADAAKTPEVPRDG
jgi:hypothetical protein